MLALVLALAGPLLLTLNYNNIQASLSSTQAQLEQLTQTIQRYESNADQRNKWQSTRKEFYGQLNKTNNRLDQLETRNLAGKRVIENAMRSVVFLQGAYSFTHPETGESLRYVTDRETGDVHTNSKGEPVLSLSGDGVVATMLFSGTGFLVSDDGKILTNRHIAIPWEDGDHPYPELVNRLGLEPRYFKFLGYLPEVDKSFEVKIAGISDAADVAVLHSDADFYGAKPLKLSDFRGKIVMLSFWGHW